VGIDGSLDKVSFRNTK